MPVSRTLSRAQIRASGGVISRRSFRAKAILDLSRTLTDQAPSGATARATSSAALRLQGRRIKDHSQNPRMEQNKNRVKVETEVEFQRRSVVMPTFGFSAYLKLISLSPKRQRYEIKSRLSPSKEGYDFHRSLQLRAHQFLVDGIPLVDVVKSTDAIGRAPEKNPLKKGLFALGIGVRKMPVTF